ncbi:ElaA protein [Formivibrio citricus]|uniref:ElaA protein n=1 Tax=Formivibrio citricus TaxID=83765 RepID=A0A1I5DET5_9NEIS|nr:GNAT family N-acetyltransferase [Formivibrio citricus]SFN97774.1 ElaA protein [Formivibrio citricus]
MNIHWQWFTLDTFDTRTLLAYLRLRQDIFVVEQKCTAPEIDDYDPPAQHLVGRDKQGRVIAALRLVPPGLKFPEPSLGRVVVHPDSRRGGTGSALLREALAKSDALWPGQGNRISAQSHLQHFYGNVGFKTVSEEYEEDGLPHVEMWRES